jgi:hypothetical protein
VERRSDRTQGISFTSLGLSLEPDSTVERHRYPNLLLNQNLSLGEFSGERMVLQPDSRQRLQQRRSSVAVDGKTKSKASANKKGADM